MNVWRRLRRVLLSAPSASAADIAVLRNGYAIRHENREEIGELTRLYISADRTSFVDIATADVERFERDDSPVFPSTPAEVAAAPVKAKAKSTIASGTTPRASAQEIADAIGLASNRYRLDPHFVSSVVSAESGFNFPAVSPKGAPGFIQFMAGTASPTRRDKCFCCAQKTN